jgi:hypothetical protein
MEAEGGAGGEESGDEERGCAGGSEGVAEDVEGVGDIVAGEGGGLLALVGIADACGLKRLSEFGAVEVILIFAGALPEGGAEGGGAAGRYRAGMAGEVEQAGRRIVVEGDFAGERLRLGQGGGRDAGERGEGGGCLAGAAKNEFTERHEGDVGEFDAGAGVRAGGADGVAMNFG